MKTGFRDITPKTKTQKNIIFEENGSWDEKGI